MKISATIKSKSNQHESFVQTNDAVKEMHIPPKANGPGSSINGGEMLMLSLATCFCNDIYREAAKWNIEINAVEVEVTGEFGGEGEAGSNFSYRTNITSNAAPAVLEDLIKHTDRVAEIQNTLRKGVSINLVK